MGSSISEFEEMSTETSITTKNKVKKRLKTSEQNIQELWG